MAEQGVQHALGLEGKQRHVTYLVLRAKNHEIHRRAFVTGLWNLATSDIP